MRPPGKAARPAGAALPAPEARNTEGAAVAAQAHARAPRRAAGRRHVAIGFAIGAILAAPLLDGASPRGSAARAADAPPLVPIGAAPTGMAAEARPALTGAPPLRAIPIAPLPHAPATVAPALPLPALPLPAPLAIRSLPIAPALAAAPALPTPVASPAPLAIGTIPVAPVAVQRPGPVLDPLPTLPRPPAATLAAPSPAPSPAPQPAPQVPAAPVAAAPVAAAPAPPASGKPADALLIASFNIQVFGESKLAKPQVVDVLTKVVRRFDIVAVQEVRAKSDGIVPAFVAAINADGSRYAHVIGPRLGRTASKEQYTFIYDTTRVEIDPSSVATLPNPGDKFHRPPLRARFRTRMNPPDAGFSFWLVDIHTDPDEVPQEVDALADAFVSMRSLTPDEDDVIVLGDLNAAPQQFGRIRQIPGIGWAVAGVPTNTRRTKTYDNLLFDRTVTAEYTGRWGVLDLQDTFGLPLEKALEVSDHNPVWAAFSPWESRRMADAAAIQPTSR
ncbi:MAG: endonuclease/exonuclease/phosphatase family protein [Planctomycetaceae bacterium]